MQKTTRYIQKSLEGIYPPEEIRAMTRLIWEDACGFSPVDVILRKDTVLDESLRKKIEVIVEKLLQQEPIQYIWDMPILPENVSKSARASSYPAPKPKN